jgi:hypothetical protein
MEIGGDSDEVAQSFTEFFHFVYNSLFKYPYLSKWSHTRLETGFDGGTFETVSILGNSSQISI